MSATQGAPREELARAFSEGLKRVAEHLPSQRPLDFFIHHNPLHHFEELPFAEGVERAAALFGAEPWLAEREYREHFKAARILERDLKAEIARAVPDEPSGVPGIDLREATLRLCRSLPAPDAGTTLRWRLEEGDGLREWLSPLPRSAREGLRDEGLAHEALPRLWAQARAAARRHLEGAPLPASAHEHGRWRDAALALTQRDPDDHAVPLLIRWCIAYVDPAFSQWPMPRREEGLLRAALRLWSSPLPDPRAWLAPLRARAEELLALTPEEVAADCLARAGVRPEEVEGLLEAMALSLPGWPGMIALLSERPDLAPGALAPMSLADFFALRLLLEEAATRDVCGLSADEPLPSLSHDRTAAQRAAAAARREDELSWALFCGAQIMGVGPTRFEELSEALVRLLERDHDVFRRRLWHLSFERRYRVEALDAFVARQRLRPPELMARSARRAPWVQVVTCIDDREESLRRHIEELDPGAQTFGFAGFFGVAMFYQPLGAPRARPLCPAPRTPQHWVREAPAEGLEATWRARQSRRATLGKATAQAHQASRGLLRGALSTLAGVAAAVPMAYRLLNPASGARRLSPPPTPVRTRLLLERDPGEGDLPAPSRPRGSSAARALYAGYTVAEMVEVVYGTLNDMGLREGFAPLVIFMGHGSRSVNNPYEAGYQCGACGGGHGGANARAFAQMANDPRVREGLRAKGISIPPETTFVGSAHDTAEDSVTFYDLDQLEAEVDGRVGAEAARAFGERLGRALELLDKARTQNAYERARRFALAPRPLTPEGALRHVEQRSYDLSEPRPEYNHATNAMQIVGPRALTEGLFIDRRAFLTSYNHSYDPEGAALTRLLSAAVPVGAGINLEYFFSFVDPKKYGCGSKLPQNIASLMGVMDGHQSDLRTGLVWQMVEIHEPMRLLNIVEAPPAVAVKVLQSIPAAWVLAKNEWTQVAVFDPATRELLLFEDGELKPYVPERDRLPVVERSARWFEGRQDNLPFALINDPALPAQEAPAAPAASAQNAGGAA